MADQYSTLYPILLDFLSDHPTLLHHVHIFIKPDALEAQYALDSILFEWLRLWAPDHSPVSWGTLFPALFDFVEDLVNGNIPRPTHRA